MTIRSDIFRLIAGVDLKPLLAQQIFQRGHAQIKRIDDAAKFQRIQQNFGALICAHVGYLVICATVCKKTGLRIATEIGAFVQSACQPGFKILLPVSVVRYALFMRINGINAIYRMSDEYDRKKFDVG